MIGRSATTIHTGTRVADNLDTLVEVAAAAPDAIAIGIECKRYSRAGRGQGLDAPDKDVSFCVLLYHFALDPLFWLLERVKAFGRGAVISRFPDLRARFLYRVSGI